MENCSSYKFITYSEPLMGQLKNAPLEWESEWHSPNNPKVHYLPVYDLSQSDDGIIGNCLPNLDGLSGFKIGYNHVVRYNAGVKKWADLVMFS